MKSQISTQPAPRKIQRYGWLPDLPDHRDFKFNLTQINAAVLPPAIDLRSKCSKIEDQGQLGSCTANALVGLLEYIEKLTDQTPTNLSRLFLYYNERVLEDTVDYDSGAYLRDGVRSLAKQGVCSEKSWPYKIETYCAAPPSTCFSSATKRKIVRYERLNTLLEMKSALANHHPFVFGFTVYEAFESSAVAQTGILNLPQNSERTLGGHAVMAVGYNDDTQRFVVRNSWGTNWGMSGYFTMPYAYLENRDLSDDFWTIYKS